MTLVEMQQAVREAQAGMTDASALMRQATTRVQELESCLNRMVHNYENTLSDSEGQYPHSDTGCIDCTAGTVPDRLNTGRCAYHHAKTLLGQS